MCYYSFETAPPTPPSTDVVAAIASSPQEAADIRKVMDVCAVEALFAQKLLQEHGTVEVQTELLRSLRCHHGSDVRVGGLRGALPIDPT